MKSTFGVAFYCRKSKLNKFGVAPVEMSVSINGKRSFIALPQKLVPEAFEKAMNSKRNNEIKSFCNNYYSKVNEAVRKLVDNGKEVTIQAVKAIITGHSKPSPTLSTLKIEYLKYTRLRVAGNEIELSTYKKYEVAMCYIIRKLGDVEVGAITSSMVDELRLMLLKDYEESTANRYLRRYKTIFSWGEERGMIEKSPFSLVKVKNVVKDVQFLTTDEVEAIASKNFGIDRLDKVRDLFLFQCFTGLAFSDMQQLVASDIKVCEQGQYIRKERQKTGVTYTILLLPKAIEILKKYDYQLPKMTNQRMNSYLKEIADCCGIKKPLHSHIGRHTAATMFLNAGLSLDEVAKILGHKCASSITAHYAKLLDTTVFEAMSKLK